MAYSFGYSGGGYAPSQLLTGVPTTSPGSTGSGSNMSPSCGPEGGPTAPSPLSRDPMSGQLLESPLSALSYPRMPLGGGMGVYGTSYAPTDQNPYPSLAMDNSSPFYGSLSSGYGMKDGSAAEMGWPAAGIAGSGYYSYDHTSLAAYGYGSGYDLASRRKNATRESTATLKAWLNEHKKNPYPTKGEKIMLAIITKMTLTQVSTWFANARRRLKKENKMTWEPKNKLDDDDVDVSDDDDKDEFRDDKTDVGLGREGLSREDREEKEGIPIPPTKPKIWSMAELAVCKTPPPGSLPWPPTKGSPASVPWPPAAQQGLPFGDQTPTMMASLRPNMFMRGGDQTFPSAGDQTFPPAGLQAFSSDMESKPEDTPPHTPPNNKLQHQQQQQHNVIMNQSAFGGSGYMGQYNSMYQDHSKMAGLHQDVGHHQSKMAGLHHGYQDSNIPDQCFNS